MKAIKIVTLMFLSVLSQAQPTIESGAISKGEQLKFRLLYGWFTVGRGTFQISENDVIRNRKKGLKIDIEGRTSGLAGVFSRVDDQWGAVIDSETFLPYYSYRHLLEGNYWLKEEVHFDYDSMKITFDQRAVSDKKARQTSYYPIEHDHVFDMIGGLMYARNINYGKLNKGDTIQLNAFFDKKFHLFKMIYHGVERIKSKVGIMDCYKIVPIMVKNSVFVKKEAITFWISTDVNRLPLKVSADMKYGTFYCELTGYRNMKGGRNFE